MWTTSGHCCPNVVRHSWTQADTAGRSETTSAAFRLACLRPPLVLTGACCATLHVMPSFQQRKAVGDAHEQHIAKELTARGWAVHPWGQGVLTQPVQAALRKTDSSSGGLPTSLPLKRAMSQ